MPKAVCNMDSTTSNGPRYLRTKFVVCCSNKEKSQTLEVNARQQVMIIKKWRAPCMAHTNEKNTMSFCMLPVIVWANRAVLQGKCCEQTF